MDEDLSEIFQLIAEDERKRRYLKDVGDWLVEEYYEFRQASWGIVLYFIINFVCIYIDFYFHIKLMIRSIYVGRSQLWSAIWGSIND